MQLSFISVIKHTSQQ